LLRRGLAASERCAGRLERSLRRLHALLPIDPAHLATLEAGQQDDIDAFLKRFEQLVLTLQDQVFVGLALREGEDPRELSRRDMTELMERLRAIPSAGEFRELVTIRNRLAHLYPEEPERQAANLNAAYQATPRLLAAARQAAGRATEAAPELRSRARNAPALVLPVAAGAQQVEEMRGHRFVDQLAADLPELVHQPLVDRRGAHRTNPVGRPGCRPPRRARLPAVTTIRHCRSPRWFRGLTPPAREGSCFNNRRLACRD
jgi:hypothetical protein